MFKITAAAAAHIRQSAQESGSTNLPLRIAAKKKNDGSLDYGIGFDDPHPEDQRIESEGIVLLIAPAHLPLLEGACMDYVNLESGESVFIFLNPQDANYQPPTEV